MILPLGAVAEMKLTNEEKKIISLRNNLIPTFHLVFRCAIHFIFYIAIIHSIGDSSYLTLFALVYINSMIWHFWGYAGIAHELHHGTVFSNRWVNRILFFICSYFTWNNPSRRMRRLFCWEKDANS